MSFYETLKQYDDIAVERLMSSADARVIREAVYSDSEDPSRLGALLSPDAEPVMEEMAQRAHTLTLQNFGRTMQLYTPLYLSDHCINRCSYCGFNVDNSLARKRLEPGEVRKEAEFIVSTGLKQVLILTGDSREVSPVSYIKDCVDILKEYFSAICIEIYALTSREYAKLIDAGVDGLTIYQEAYDEDVYDAVHISGPKKDYKFRLAASERAASEGMRTINIGALLGLASWRREAFLLGMHAKYLQDNFPGSEISVSIPRLRPHTGDFCVEHTVSDKNIVQIVTALRLFLPRLGITLSTREAPEFRENLLPLGITKMSAGSTTTVGGHTAMDNTSCQFEIADQRDVEEVKDLLKTKGYQPILKDWVGI